MAVFVKNFDTWIALRIYKKFMDQPMNVRLNVKESKKIAV